VFVISRSQQGLAQKLKGKIKMKKAGTQEKSYLHFPAFLPSLFFES